MECDCVSQIIRNTGFSAVVANEIKQKLQHSSTAVTLTKRQIQQGKSVWVETTPAAMIKNYNSQKCSVTNET